MGHGIRLQELQILSNRRFNLHLNARKHEVFPDSDFIPDVLETKDRAWASLQQQRAATAAAHLP